MLVLGDQLALNSNLFDDFDPAQDAVWMAEVAREATHVRCHKLRIAVFFSAMRHFRDDLRERGWAVHYTELPADPDDDRGESLGEVLGADLARRKPDEVRVTQPGDVRVQREIEAATSQHGLDLTVVEDGAHLISLDEFEDWAKGRKQLLLETFYRHMRKTHQVLMTEDGEPVGGQWNFDRDNRETYSARNPPNAKVPRRFSPDEITDEVVALVAERFADHPGSLEHFDLPVTRKQARAALRDFIDHRLRDFGTFQDAMWRDEPFLRHSRLSVPLNLGLLTSRECIEAAEHAYDEGKAELHDVEGFIRQVLGWREFVRGLYFHLMPDYADRNALECDDRDVPGFYWDGQTDIECVRQAMHGVVEHGYAHHIQRLMVLGLFAQLLGVHPYRFHEWHMAMYLDAVDWVSLPNALGMSQYGDGGVVGTKPYCASGKYIDRMSNHCRDCPYDPSRATGAEACPFTTLYWDFLAQHESRFDGNRRMAFQLKNLRKKREKGELDGIRHQASALRRRIDRGGSTELGGGTKVADSSG
jgi:deoxyribodipyrimidine photolyase-related protein